MIEFKKRPIPPSSLVCQVFDSASLPVPLLHWFRVKQEYLPALHHERLPLNPSDASTHKNGLINGPLRRLSLYRWWHSSFQKDKHAMITNAVSDRTDEMVPASIA
jgi:hypothetical protein